MAFTEIDNHHQLRKLAAVFFIGTVLSACGSGGSEDTVEDTVVTTPPPVTAPETGPNSDACLASTSEVLQTAGGIEYVVTPDACFDALPDYDFAANSIEIEGLSMNYVDEGPQDGEVVLMLHGQPSWSYLYRKMIPILAGAGYRVIAPDHIGMGRSDKPTDVSIHHYEQHVAWMKEFITQMELTDINLFVQDWGSIIGLRVAGEMSEHIARLTVANGELFMYQTGQNPYTYPSFEIDESLGNYDSIYESMSMSGSFEEAFQKWIDYAANAPELVAGDVLQKLTTIELSDEEVSAYNAPYPSLEYKAAIRAFPSMLSGIEMQNQVAWQTLGAFHNPFMFNAGEGDRNMGSVENQQKWIQHLPGSDGVEHRRFDAGHFIQDDVGHDLGLHFLDFLETTTPQEPLMSGGTIFNYRYCEILLAYEDDAGVTAEVWGTPGLNQCPQAQWDALDFEQIATDSGALNVIPNGPRFFIMDEIINGDTVGEGIPPEIQQFGNLPMSLLTTADITDTGGETAAYVASAVSRGNTWAYKQGRRIYELIDDSGQAYVMQSFSQLYDSSMQIDDLKDLADRLELPSGWSYNSRILTEPLLISAVDGIAMVLQDDFGNSYQLAP